jgi:hypothetical protein
VTLERDGFGQNIDLYAFTMHLAALQDEAEKMGMPFAHRAVAEDMRTKFIPSLALQRERSQKRNA